MLEGVINCSVIGRKANSTGENLCLWVYTKPRTHGWGVHGPNGRTYHY